MISNQIVLRVSKRLFFHDIVHFVDGENIVTFLDVDIDCCSTLYPEAPPKIRQIIRERKWIPEPVQNPESFQATINLYVLLMSSESLISFWTRTIYEAWLQQLLCHSSKLTIETICTISTINQ